MSCTGYSGDMNYTAFTPVDDTGDAYSVFRSGYKNIRFALPPLNQVTLDNSMAYNMPGLAYKLYQDSSAWLPLLAYNGLSDPLTDVYPGLTLNIPSKAALVAYAGAQSATTVNTQVTV